MHGSQGGTVLHSTLKSKRLNRKRPMPEPGADFASDRFVMITPKCEWKWKTLPKKWVIHLVRQFLTATWCDSSRIYATGYSMGGMGCWELASSSPGFFSAVAVVGAYHRKDRRAKLVKGLRNTPIFAVQSSRDKRCPLEPESQLWEQLTECGNQPVIKENVRVGHGSLWSEAYAKDTQLWDFLLAHRK